MDLVALIPSHTLGFLEEAAQAELLVDESAKPLCATFGRQGLVERNLNDTAFDGRVDDGDDAWLLLLLLLLLEWGADAVAASRASVAVGGGDNIAVAAGVVVAVG